MASTSPIFKPRAVTRAVAVVWVWIVFLALSGVYQGWVAVPQLREALQPLELQLPDDRALFLLIAGAYWLGALTMVGVTFALNAGKNGGRITLLLSFLLDFVVTVFSFERTLSDFILTPVDIGLQAYALWLVYTRPGSLWFRPRD